MVSIALERLIIAAAVGFLLLFSLSAQGTTVTFQQGIDGYSSTDDVQLRLGSPNTNYGNLPYMYIYPSNTIQSLIRFDDIFGTGAGQIGYGDTIISASLGLAASS